MARARTRQGVVHDRAGIIDRDPYCHFHVPVNGRARAGRDGRDVLVNYRRHRRATGGARGVRARRIRGGPCCVGWSGSASRRGSHRIPHPVLGLMRRRTSLPLGDRRRISARCRDVGMRLPPIPTHRSPTNSHDRHHPHHQRHERPPRDRLRRGRLRIDDGADDQTSRRVFALGLRGFSRRGRGRRWRSRC